MVIKKYYIISERDYHNVTNIYTLPSFNSYKRARERINQLKTDVDKYGKWIGIQVIKNKNGETYTGVLDKFYI